ncbi:MAG: hypothetical protein R3325_00305 [Thermoanaerobaculia bacterium]|nr:hypothetical protein [Thermoanaerobaculia bacterium]
MNQGYVDYLSLPTIRLQSFRLRELGVPLPDLPAQRRAAFAEAARLDGAFTVELPAAWDGVIQQMIPRAHGVARRYLKREGGFHDELTRFNDGRQPPHGPVWPADRTRSDDPDEYQPQRGIFVRLERLWDVYRDPVLVLGFLAKQFVRAQALCRLLELLQIPPGRWSEATGSAVDGAWLGVAEERRELLDRLLERAGRTDGDDGLEREVADLSAVWQAGCGGWYWSSLNFYLYDGADSDLERTEIRPVEDLEGNRGFAATLLHEHSDYDFVASVVNNMTGLQARDRQGRWHRVEPGPLLLNVGKAMQLLAGDRYENGRIVGDAMRAIPHRVVLQGATREAVREQLESVRRRISIVGVTEPHGEEASLLSWDRERGELYPVPGLEHCKFWQFLTRNIPDPPAVEGESRTCG